MLPQLSRKGTLIYTHLYLIMKYPFIVARYSFRPLIWIVALHLRSCCEGCLTIPFPIYLIFYLIPIGGSPNSKDSFCFYLKTPNLGWHFWIYMVKTFAIKIVNIASLMCKTNLHKNDKYLILKHILFNYYSSILVFIYAGPFTNTLNLFKETLCDAKHVLNNSTFTFHETFSCKSRECCFVL